MKLRKIIRNLISVMNRKCEVNICSSGNFLNKANRESKVRRTNTILEVYRAKINVIRFFALKF